MLPSLVLGTATVAAACAACSDRTPADPSAAPASTARPAAPIELRDPDGAVVVSFESDGHRCAGTAQPQVVVTRNGSATEIGGSALTIERTPAGDQLSRQGLRVARVWRDPARPGHTDVVDPQGMALVRIDATTTAATLTDAGGSAVATVVFEGGRFIARDPADRALAYVTGGDAETAALLASPLPLDVRAVAVCDRLLPAPVTP